MAVSKSFHAFRKNSKTLPAVCVYFKSIAYIGGVWGKTPMNFTWFCVISGNLRVPLSGGAAAAHHSCERGPQGQRCLWSYGSQSPAPPCTSGPRLPITVSGFISGPRMISGALGLQWLEAGFWFPARD